MTQTVLGASSATPSFPGLDAFRPAQGAAPPLATPQASAEWRANAPLPPVARVDAEYSLRKSDFFRDDVWKFGHDGGTYHLERTQDGRVVRTARGTEQSDPELVAGVRRLEQQAAATVAGGGGPYQPGDRRPYSYSHSRHDRYYDASDFVALDDRTTNRRAWLLNQSRAALELVEGVRALDRREGITVEGTDGGEPGGWEKFGKVAMVAGAVAAGLGLAYLVKGARYR